MAPNPKGRVAMLKLFPELTVPMTVSVPVLVHLYTAYLKWPKGLNWL